MDFHRRRKLAAVAESRVAPVHPFPFHRALAFSTFLLSLSDSFFYTLKTEKLGWTERLDSEITALFESRLCAVFVGIFFEDTKKRLVLGANFYTADLNLEKLCLILICTDKTHVSS